MTRTVCWIVTIVLLGALWARGTDVPPACQAPPARPDADIAFTNYTDGTTVRHVAPLVRGALADKSLTSVTLVNESSRRASRTITGPACQGRFVVLCELAEGENRLVLQAGKQTKALRLTYRPQTNPRFVRVAYLTDSSGETKFQTPLADDRQDYRGKLDTALKVMQTFTAERMYDLGFGRKTFNLELDGEGRVVVHTLRGGHSLAEYHKMNDDQLWDDAAGQVAKVTPKLDARWLVIPAFTRWDAKAKRALGHTALGGGTLAFFGGGDLFAWPDRLADVHRAFCDERRVDPAKFFSDSVDRHTFWAVASTTMGAALHELGHTLDLPHSSDPFCIMTRGHDYFNRVFTLVEPPHAGRAKPYVFREDEIARWSPPSAAWRACHRFLAMDKRPWKDADPPRAAYDAARNAVVIDAPNGLAGIVVCLRGEPCSLAAAEECKARPRQLVLGLADLRPPAPPEDLSLRLVDSEGLTAGVCLDTLVARRYVRSWRLSAVTSPWPDQKVFPEVDERKLAAIVKAAPAKPATAAGALVDLNAAMPPGPRDDVAAYAVRTIVCERPRKVKLLAGSDDSIRVWVNGRTVLKTLALRAAQADEDSTLADLRAGENTVVVEVCQASGEWGFYLRLQDEAGKDLVLREDGRLAELGQR